MQSKRLQYTLPIVLFLVFGVIASWWLYRFVLNPNSDNDYKTEIINENKSECKSFSGKVLEISTNNYSIGFEK